MLTQVAPCAASNDSSRIIALDGLRGLAILLVTLYRFAKEAFPEIETSRIFTSVIKCGSTGVDLFFVLSGFLVTTILLEAKSGPNFFSRFYYHRTLRIFPVYFGSLLTFLYVLPWFTGGRLFFADAYRNQLYFWTYTSNLKMCFEGAWCFGYLDHFWSLAIEEQFYVAWPICVFLMSTRMLLHFSLVAIVLSLMTRALFCLATENQVCGELFTLFRCDGLLLGACVAILRQNGCDLSRHFKLASITLGIGVLVFGLGTFFGFNTFKLHIALVAFAWSWFLVMVLSSNPNSYLTRILESRPFRALGKHSYAMYVIQNPLIPMASIAGVEAILQNELVGGACYVILMSLITFALSVFIWYGVEVWFLRLRSGSARALR